MADLEHVLHWLHDSEINAGVQTFFDAGMRVWIGDEMNGIRAQTVINRTAVARLKARRALCGELATRDCATATRDCATYVP
jgi:hypothetical protein